MRAGERPHVLAGERRHDVATAILSVNAVEALAEQILSNDGRHELRERGSVAETIQSPSFPHPLMAKAERVGDDFSVELIVKMPTEAPSASSPEPEPTPYQQADPTPDVSTSRAEFPEPEPVDEQPVSDSAPSMDTPIYQQYEAPAPPPVTVVARVEEPRPAMRTVTSPASGERLDLQGWITRGMARGATMLFLRAGSPASARVDDRIQQLSDDLVDASVLDEVSSAFARGGDGLWQTRSEGEWIREYQDLGQVSCRMFSDHHGFGLVLQMRPVASPTLLHKHIPRQVRTVCEGEGLIVVSAPTEGAVESLALALADWSGRTRGGYLISLQRRSLRGDIAGAFVSMRTITGSDAEFATAVRRASQEGPDILLVTGPQTELPLHEAILAATGGRLVIVGVVAPTTVGSLRVLLGQTGLDRDAHLRRALAASFRAAVGYRGVRRIGGGRLLIQDVIMGSSDVRPLLEAADFDGLVTSQRQGSSGMRSVDEALARAIHRGHVSLREAASHAVDRRHLVALVRMLAHARLSRSAVSRRGDREIAPISLDSRRWMDRVGTASR